MLLTTITTASILPLVSQECLLAMDRKCWLLYKPFVSP